MQKLIFSTVKLKMTKRKQRSNRKRKFVKAIPVKRKFATAIKKLKQMKAAKQRSSVIGASNEFIRDVSNFMTKIRKHPQTVKASHRKILKRHSKKLRKLIHAKTPIESKRMILSQTGGILPALIPVICALIGAGGGIAGAATSAAIIKN